MYFVPHTSYRVRPPDLLQGLRPWTPRGLPSPHPLFCRVQKILKLYYGNRILFRITTNSSIQPLPLSARFLFNRSWNRKSLQFRP